MKKTATLFITLTTLIMLSGCSSPVSKTVQGEALTPPPEGYARIIFKRHANLFGGVVKHYVADAGTNLQHNAHIEQKKSYPESKGNFDKMMNVRRLYLKLNEIEAKLILGRPGPQDKSVTRPITKKEAAFASCAEVLKAYVRKHSTYCILPSINFLTIRSKHDFWLNSDSLNTEHSTLCCGGNSLGRNNLLGSARRIHET